MVPQRLGSGGARSLPVDALERLRRQAVAAVESGIPQTQVAREFGVSRKAVGSWVRAYQSGGESTFRPQPRGRRAGERLALSERQQAWVVRSMAAGPPDEHGLPGLLWTRNTVAKLISSELGISLAGATVDKYLLRWELISREGPFTQRSWCPPGTLLVAWTRPRPPAAVTGLHALVAVSQRRLLHFLAGEHPFTAAGLAEFRNRLRMQFTREVRLWVCDWPDAQSALLEHWPEVLPETAVR